MSVTKDMQIAVDSLQIIENDIQASIDALSHVNRGELGEGRSSHAELRMAIEVLDKLRTIPAAIRHRLIERQ